MFRYDKRKVRRGFGLQNCSMGNTCFADEFDPEQLNKFEVIEFKDQIKDGWKLASVSDVKENLIPAKYTLLSESEWIICKLEDGSMKGSGFGFAIDIYYNGGWKYKLIIKKELSKDITRKDKERTYKDIPPSQKEKAPTKRKKDPQQKEKVPDKKEENPTQKSKKDNQQKEKTAPQKEKTVAQKDKDPPPKNKITPEKQKSSPEKEKKVQQKEKSSPQKETSPPQKKKAPLQKEQISPQKEKSPPQTEKSRPDKEKIPTQKKKNLPMIEETPPQKEETPPQKEKSPLVKEKISPQKKKSLPQEDKIVLPKKKSITREEKDPPQRETFLSVPGRPMSSSDAPSSKSSPSRSGSDVLSSRSSRSRSTSENSEGEKPLWRNRDRQKVRGSKTIKERDAGIPQKRKGDELDAKSPKVKPKTPQMSRLNVEKPYVSPRFNGTNKPNETNSKWRPQTAPSKERRNEEKENLAHERSGHSIMGLILKEGRTKVPNKRPKTALGKSEKGMDLNEKPKTSSGKQKPEKGIVGNERPHISVLKEKSERDKLNQRPRTSIGKKIEDKEKTVSKERAQNVKNLNPRPKTAAASKGRFIVSPAGQQWDKDEPDEDMVSHTSSTSNERWKFNDKSGKSGETWSCSKLGKKVAPQRNYKGEGTPPPLPVSAFLLSQSDSDTNNWKIHTHGRRQESATRSLDEMENEKKTRKESSEPKRFVKHWPCDIDSISSGNNQLGVGNTDSVFLRITR